MIFLKSEDTKPIWESVTTTQKATCASISLKLNKSVLAAYTLAYDEHQRHILKAQSTRHNNGPSEQRRRQIITETNGFAIDEYRG